MQIVKTSRFLFELENIIDFIARDSWNRALGFKNKLDSKILNLPHFPLKHRQSQTSDNPNLRELIHKGYTIAYLVDESSSQIIILGIFNQNQWEI